MKTMTKILTLNGLTLDAKFIRPINGIDAFLFYCQDRLVITDYDYNEIKSLDVIDFILTRANIHKLCIDDSKMNNELNKWMHS